MGKLMSLVDLQPAASNATEAMCAAPSCKLWIHWPSDGVGLVEKARNGTAAW
jgi:hypothetical protein